MPTDTALFLNSIAVEGLFDRFDYRIPLLFPASTTPGLVIITAPNGYGKSTLLKLVNDIAHGDYFSVSRTDFRSVTLETSEAVSLRIDRTVPDDDQQTAKSRPGVPTRLQFTLTDNTAGGLVHGPWESTVRDQLEEDYDEDRFATRHNFAMLDRELPFLRRVGPSEWRDMRNGSILSRSEVMRMAEGRGAGGRGLAQDEPEWLTSFRSRLKVLYISANRLRVELDRSARRYRATDMVGVWAERIQEQIRDAFRQYAERGRRQEQRFPARIISALRDRETVSQEQVASLVEEVGVQERRFQDLGMVSSGQSWRNIESLPDKAALVVLKAYLEDIKSKFEALEDTAKRLEIFVESINSMLLFKSLRPSIDAGFQIRSDKGRQIPLTALSSGEQHLIVLLGELVFGSTVGETILLDEPEISFHPEWQERFPRVLSRIIEVNHCAIVMATHSPTLIQDNWDSAVELADQVQG